MPLLYEVRLRDAASDARRNGESKRDWRHPIAHAFVAHHHVNERAHAPSKNAHDSGVNRDEQQRDAGGRARAYVDGAVRPDRETDERGHREPVTEWRMSARSSRDEQGQCGCHVECR